MTEPIDQAIKEPETKMTLRKGFMLYIILTAILVLLITLASLIAGFPGWIGFFFYLIAGYVLNRQLLGKLVQWHPNYNTLGDVSSTKLKLFLFWPISYFFLFIQLGINKFL